MSNTTAPMSKPKKQAIPTSVYIALAAGILAISASAILIRFAQAESVPSLLIAAARLVLAALILTPVALRQHQQQLANLTRSDVLLAMLSGFFLAVHFAAWVSSLEYTSVLVSVVLVCTSPIWVALLEVFFLKARLSRWVVVGLVISIGGSVLIGLGGLGQTDGNIDTVRSTNDLIGGTLSLIGALAVAVYMIIGRKLRAHMPVIPYIWLVYGCAALVLIIALIFTGTPIIGYSPTAYMLLVAMALIPQLIGHSALNYAVGYLPATLVTMITQFEPIGSAILAMVVFNEVPFPLQIVGSLVILGGVMLASTAKGNKSS